ncbi:hypothetical protein IFM89_035488 [Coptis chinensis]|uniref:Golgin candidate 2 n=1 Tax=Coptis chinensis TaxID=261450 RepID=A0A835LKH2_9MAGN|nr:hypothetical protein IFM89_035488 [Coptis chinensis]
MSLFLSLSFETNLRILKCTTSKLLLIIMSNWISSKLKVAETFLQQIDQTAAESLKKGENTRSDELNYNHQTIVSRKVESIVPIKDQLKKKNSLESNHLYTTPLRKEAVIISDIKTPPKPTPSSTPPLTDSDWTQLLSTPQVVTLPSANGGYKSRGAGKLVELKKNQSGGFKSSTRKTNIVLGNRVNGKRNSDGEESGSSDSTKRISNVGSQNGDGDIGEKVVGFGESVSPLGVTHNPEMKPVAVKDDVVPEVKKQVDVSVDEPESNVRSSISSDLHGGSSSSSDGTSASESDSSSTSDSEKEREKKARRERRRERVVAVKAAAKAVEVIKEHENIVARLEGEKQSLEKILEERAKQQAQEASELQMTMMETMNAVDLEKQKHSYTRMEAFTRLTKLETTNADLAKSLATIQWNLEIESKQVADIRQQIDVKEAIQEDLRRRILNIHQHGSSPKLEASKGVEFEREILEAEYSVICDKIGQLQEKEKKLEENIEILRKEMDVPTAVEVELKRRLTQLTNHLIQKQSQVEALSAEKATMLFRIETVSRLLEEHKLAPQVSDIAGPSSSEDLEAGTWEVSKAKLRPLFANNIQSGSRHLGSLLRQLDVIFSAGAAFLRRNSSAKFFALVYLVCLHFWVSYIFMSHSQASDSRSGAIISLESINKTSGP